MNRTTSWLAIATCLGVLSGCGGSDGAGDPTIDPPRDVGLLDTGAPSDDTGALPDDSGASVDDSAAPPPDGAPTDAGPVLDSGGVVGLPKLGTLVILGDSIGDGGGGAPFYYDLLRADLGKRYGAIDYRRNAKSGSKTSDLSAQIDSLPASLAGPVAVCITSGGNDMKAAFAQIVTGTDGPARTAMGNNVKAALDKLLKPGRFGAGVEVHVYEGNVYDASDGAGDYGSHACKFSPPGFPPQPTDKFFTAWNGEILAQVTAHAQTSADMHAWFYGHGYKSTPDWYASDCTHPSTIGHDNLRRLFYLKITGEKLP